MSVVVTMNQKTNIFSDKIFPNTLTMSKCLSKNSISHKIISDTDIKVENWKSPFFIDSYYGQKEAHIYFAHDVFGQKNQDVCALEALSSEFTCERYDCNARIFPNSVAIYFGCSIDLNYFNTDQKLMEAIESFGETLDEFTDRAIEYGFTFGGDSQTQGLI
ncbi:hypothetical protein [Novosphingobium sp. AAP83]|uniref:hypothetical protein n=1 Tax=Novosphingobium sp. AAP83 TaxID=1523425 RepID=UPI000A49B73C|nr:hypothetical protein [Novosphingobium sp. AAP83]